MASRSPGNPMSDNCSIEPFEWNANDESLDFYPPLSLSLYNCLSLSLLLQYLLADRMAANHIRNSRGRQMQGT